VHVAEIVKMDNEELHVPGRGKYREVPNIA
jgi:hypothetical protein